jgi:hypothetical protein
LWPKMHKKTLLNQWNQMSMPRNERKGGRISFSCRRNVCIPVRDIAVQQCRRETKMVLLLVVQISQRATCHSGIIASPKTIKEETLNIDL